MREEIAFDDLAALDRVIGQGMGDWGSPFHIGAALVAAFHAVIGTKDMAGAVPGMMLQALLPRLVPPPGWHIAGYRGAINLGSPSIRFPEPLHGDTTVCGRSCLRAVRRHPRGMIHSLGFEVREEPGHAPALLSTSDILYLGGEA